MLREKITVYRNINDMKNMSNAIYRYKKENKNGNKTLKFLNDFFTGFGEKPIRLIRLFVFLHLVFGSIFYFIPSIEVYINEKLISDPSILDIIYFNNTTFFTIGYGDFLPGNNITKIFVMMSQIFGFIVAGSFVTLSLRKMFRY